MNAQIHTSSANGETRPDVSHLFTRLPFKFLNFHDVLNRCIWFVLTLFILSPTFLLADSYTIESVSVDATINADGTVRYVEHRTYSFDGNFTWANYNLPKSGFSEITDIQVSDKNHQYTHENSEDPYTFQIATNDKSIDIKWFYQAEDESKTFTIAYTLHNAIAIGPVWSQFQLIYVSDKWKKTTKQADVLLTLPKPVGQDSIHNWIHGAVSKASFAVGNGRVSATASNITSSEYLQVKTLFPTRILNNPTVTEPNLTLVSVLQTEQQYEEHLEEARQNQTKNMRLGTYLSILIAILSFIVWLIFYRKYGQRYKPRGVPETLYSRPTDDPPPIVGWLVLSKTISGSHLVATIFDLARRGYFRIVQEPGEKKFLQKKKERFRIEQVPEDELSASLGELTSWEWDLYDYVVNSMENGSVYFDELTDQRSVMSKWFKQWAKSVKGVAESRGWYDAQSLRGAIYNALIQFVLLCGGIATIVLAEPYGLIGTLPALFFGIMSLVIYRRTQEGEKIYRQWAAFKKGLKSHRSHRMETENIDTLFVFAVALGLSESDITKWLESTHLENSAFPWIFFLPGMHANAAAIASSMSTLAATGLQSVSSVAGVSGATAASSAGGAGGGAG